MRIDRRQLLTTLSVTAAFGGLIPVIGQAAGSRDPRLIVIVLRGALDGLTAVPPIGDPDYASLRGDLAVDKAAALPLNDLFGLHPSLVNLARQYHAGQATILHACASPYRDRSHFDGQDVLESGYSVPGHTESGWLNRFLETLPAEQKVGSKGLGIGSTTPLIMRGPADVLGWAPSTLRAADPDLAPRLMDLYTKSDPALASLLDEAIKTGKIASGQTPITAMGGAGDPKTMVAMAEGTARLLTAADGPRVAALAFEGWDTHAREAQRLTQLLTGFDNALGAFETTLGPVWNQTAILVVTEFGRTAAVNGTQGTDHGTATMAFLTGGAVKGGRVIADWPGLKAAQLYQGRDLTPTTDLRAVAKGLMAELYDTSSSALARRVFPDSAGVAPMRGLIV
ncbi:DUF1501 domain-containing protein [Asticcacaulis benevestitus]|uniref:DUF1501 domain-containing protein n=1 Tax=Asticcacaulis benevestitus DSM 16100 = ATCC BAA-896 TaxID=1121022 RepID=V4PIX2_9CAUL|nr:DUF1501 domain-containing protein [Asticcacaulis benevestitus]ESQ88116.1 hypothetical protein ABENE_16435 [Asticcacaulis benevestitus DSM 16100 = ATCC BAA-896]